jgi:hypothetical protein
VVAAADISPQEALICVCYWPFGRFQQPSPAVFLRVCLPGNSILGRTGYNCDQWRSGFGALHPLSRI